MKRGSIMVAALALCGCGGLSAVDERALRHACVLNGMAYAREDASTPTAALERGAYCSTAGIMKRNRVEIPDAGIECEKP